MILDKQQRKIEARKHHKSPEQRRTEANERAAYRATLTPSQQIERCKGRGAPATSKEIVRLAKLASNAKDAVREGMKLAKETVKNLQGVRTEKNLTGPAKATGVTGGPPSSPAVCK